jgi:hypothetical protein
MLLPILVLVTIFPAADRTVGEKPLFREFMGVNGHTIQFKPKLYAPAVRAVRDYHPIDWDLGDNTSLAPPFPAARNGVQWDQVYGSWKAAGFESEVCLMFDNFPKKSWKALPGDAFAYGQAFARSFGPSSTNMAAAVEVGNEPGLYDDETYRRLFEKMAAGLRAGDPKLKVGTCALTLGESDRYSKSVKCIRGLENLYDFVNIHSYAEVEGYPTWRRSYPEDPKIDYLKRIDRLIEWRDKHSPGKEVRITEFGWDATKQKPPKTGDFARWVGSTEEQQAQYLVRSFLIFSRRDVTRAYIFFFDDNDEPHVHGASGLTRKGQPKPAFHAVAHLQKTLGDYRFHKVLREDTDGAFVYEFVHGAQPTKRVWAVWSPTGSGKSARVALPLGGLRVMRAERMPLAAGERTTITAAIQNRVATIQFDERPIYLVLEQ